MQFGHGEEQLVSKLDHRIQEKRRCTGNLLFFSPVHCKCFSWSLKTSRLVTFLSTTYGIWNITLYECCVKSIKMILITPSFCPQIFQISFLCMERQVGSRFSIFTINKKKELHRLVWAATLGPDQIVCGKFLDLSCVHLQRYSNIVVCY